MPEHDGDAGHVWPFTLTAGCVNSRGTWDAKITVSSSQAQVEVDGNPLSGTGTVADTGPVFSSTEAKTTGVDFAAQNYPADPVAYWGDVMTIAQYGGFMSASCMVSALIMAS